MVGGATGGYCAIGNCVIATAPKTRKNSARTIAKIGRSMKNLAMDAPDQRLAAAEAADAATTGAVAGALAFQGTGLTGPPGRIFWKPSTPPCSPGFRPSSTIQLPASVPPSRTTRVDGLPSAPTTSTVS